MKRKKVRDYVLNWSFPCQMLVRERVVRRKGQCPQQREFWILHVWHSFVRVECSWSIDLWSHLMMLCYIWFLVYSNGSKFGFLKYSKQNSFEIKKSFRIENKWMNEYIFVERNQKSTTTTTKKKDALKSRRSQMLKYWHFKR